jgi:hypothetical protein
MRLFIKNCHLHIYFNNVFQSTSFVHNVHINIPVPLIPQNRMRNFLKDRENGPGWDTISTFLWSGSSNVIQSTFHISYSTTMCSISVLNNNDRSYVDPANEISISDFVQHCENGQDGTKLNFCSFFRFSTCMFALLQTYEKFTLRLQDSTSRLRKQYYLYLN